jgi:hypothetical protein
MKILLTSDLHLTVPWFEWLNTKAAAFDLVCLGGPKHPKVTGTEMVGSPPRTTASPGTLRTI